MQEQINEKVSVIFAYYDYSGVIMPKKMRWHGKEYVFTQLTYYHKIREGRSIHHIFHVTDGNMDFRLRLDSENLHFILEEIYDGN